MLKVHESEFTLVKGKAFLSEYQFHSQTARHYFCRVCGIYPFHRKRVSPDYYGINVHCLDGFPIENYDVRETHGSRMS